MTGLGETLKESRQRHRLSLEEAAAATKISLKYLKAIEAEDYATLPASVYVKGFLRRYALFLDLDPEKILGLYPQAHRGAAWEPMPPSFPALTHLGSGLAIAGVLILMLVSGLFLYWWWGG